MSGGNKHGRLRKALCVFVVLLTLFLVGTVVVLTTVVQYFGVDWRDVITEPEMKRYEVLAQRAMNNTKLSPIEVQSSSNSLSTAQDVQNIGAEILNNNDLNDFAQASDSESTSQLEDAESFDPTEYAAEEDSDQLVGNLARRDPASTDPQPRIPKIIHQTWKTDVLPERWDNVRKACMEMHPD